MARTVSSTEGPPEPHACIGARPRLLLNSRDNENKNFRLRDHHYRGFLRDALNFDHAWSELDSDIRLYCALSLNLRSRCGILEQSPLPSAPCVGGSPPQRAPRPQYSTAGHEGLQAVLRGRGETVSRFVSMSYSNGMIAVAQQAELLRGCRSNESVVVRGGIDPTCRTGEQYGEAQPQGYRGARFPAGGP